MSLNQKAKELTDEIKSTVEFLELKQAKALIEKDKSLKRELEGFNRKQEELYSSKITETEFKTRVEELNKKLSELSGIREVDIYLKASKRFNDMMAKVYKYINESIEADVKSR